LGWSARRWVHRPGGGDPRRGARSRGRVASGSEAGSLTSSGASPLAACEARSRQ
jgi:hypothetical protein